MTHTFVPDMRIFDRQREWQRRAAVLTVVAKYDKTMQLGAAVDVSLGGMQVKGVGGLRRGTLIEVQLITGETYRGVVAWSSIDRVGIKYHRPLDATDVIFKASGRILLNRAD